MDREWQLLSIIGIGFLKSRRIFVGGVTSRYTEQQGPLQITNAIGWPNDTNGTYYCNAAAAADLFSN